MKKRRRKKKKRKKNPAQILKVRGCRKNLEDKIRILASKWRNRKHHQEIVEKGY
jgi:hypothetical protein